MKSSQQTILTDYSVEYSIKAKRVKNSLSKSVTNSKTAADFAKSLYKDDILFKESCFILTLNRQNEITGYTLISQGGVSSTIMDIKLIALIAIESLASGIILVHNHPSGNPKPGSVDISSTKAIKEALNLLEVNLLDHIILCESNYYSFAESEVKPL